MEYQGQHQNWQEHHQELHSQIGGTQIGLSLHKLMSRVLVQIAQLLLSVYCLQVHCLLSGLQNFHVKSKVSAVRRRNYFIYGFQNTLLKWMYKSIQFLKITLFGTNDKIFFFNKNCSDNMSIEQ